MARSSGQALRIGPADGVDTVEAAWVALTAVDFYAFDGACGPAGQTRVHDDTVLNLFGDTGLMLRVPDGLYCSVALPGQPVSADQLPNGAPESLVGAVMVVQGHRADGVAYELVADIADRDTNLFIEDPGTEFPGGPDRRFILSWDFGALFGGIDLNDAAVGSDGSIRIDSTDNAALLTAVLERQIPPPIRLHPDEDRDGNLDPEELSITLAKGGL